MSSKYAFFKETSKVTIDTLFHEQNQSLFKRTDLGRYLGIVDIAQNSEGLNSHYFVWKDVKKQAKQALSCSSMIGGGKNLLNILVTIDDAKHILLHSKKVNAFFTAKSFMLASLTITASQKNKNLGWDN